MQETDQHKPDLRTCSGPRVCTSQQIVCDQWLAYRTRKFHQSALFTSVGDTHGEVGEVLDGRPKEALIHSPDMRRTL